MPVSNTQIQPTFYSPYTYKSLFWNSSEPYIKSLHYKT